MNDIELLKERDAIAFVGLLAFGYFNFDLPISQNTAPDNEVFTHHKGLNIFACIIENTTGRLLSIQQNSIHKHENPLLHAEQLALHQAISIKSAENTQLRAGEIWVEEFYRKYLFGDNGEDFLHKGCTLYTTLQPCPFCASALLVSRMRRVVYIIPDPKFGKNTFQYLKNEHYPEYKIEYGALNLAYKGTNALTLEIGQLHKKLMDLIDAFKMLHPSRYDTLLLDERKDILGEAATLFKSLSPLYPINQKLYQAFLTRLPLSFV